MKNLKRILSLALASVMVMGMMVVGASAAFNDQADINAVNANAVNTMVALKIISGKEGNKFDPKGNVTRAEMATMIAMALNGGNADFRGTTTTGFTDVDGAKPHWAAKFIKYCVDQGILSGVGGGKFNPDANVTAQEAATMVLTAMGYKKEMLKSETSDWAAKINLKAEQRRLYDDTAVKDYTEDLDRENAAQMIYNGITVGTPVIQDTYNTTTGEHMYSVQYEAGNPSILKSAFKADMKFAVLKKSVYDAATGKFTYTLDSTGMVDPLNGTGNNNQTGTANITITSTQDVSDLYQQMVKVIYSDSNTTVNAKTTIIGINKAEGGVLATGVWSDYEEKGGKVDGYTLATGIDQSDATYFNGAAASRPNGYDKYALIDSIGDGKIDAIVVYPLSVETVKGVKDGVVTTDLGVYTLENKDASKVNSITADTLAVGDYITVDKAPDLLTKLTKVEPMVNVTATWVSSDNSEVTVNGQTYYKNNKSIAADGKGYDIVVVNDYVMVAKLHDASTAATIDLSKVLYVAEYGKTLTQNTNQLDDKYGAYTQKAAVIFANGDGKLAYVDVANFGTKQDNGKTVPNPITAANAGATPAVVANYLGYKNGVSDNFDAAQDTGLYTFTEKDGKYSLVKLAENGLTDVGYTETTETDKIEDGKQVQAGGPKLTLRFDDNAVVVVAYTKSQKRAYALLTGADINGWETPTTKTSGQSTVTTIDSTRLFHTTNANGFKYVGFGLIDFGTDNLPGAKESKANYGYVTADAVKAWNASANNGKGATQPQVTIWDGETSNTYFVNAKNAVDDQAFEAADITAGQIYEYKLTDGVITTLTAAANVKTTAVTALAGETVSFRGLTGEYDMSDAVQIFVKASKNSGEAAGVVTMADKYENGDLKNNVKVIVNENADGHGKKAVELIVVDVDKNFDSQLAQTDVRVGAVAAVANFEGEADENVTLPIINTLTAGKVLAEDDSVLYSSIANNLTSGTAAVAANSTAGALVKLNIKGMKAGDKIKVNNSAEQELDAGEDVYVLVGNKGKDTPATQNGTMITVTITYTPATGGSAGSYTYGTPVTMTLKYASWGF